jgi:hypothetical protein
MRWEGHVASMGQKRGAYRVFAGKPEERKPLGRLRRIWEDNIKIDLQEIESGAWIGLIRFRVETGGGHL